MPESKSPAMVWVKDDAGNRFMCPMDALRNPDSLSEEEKKNCLHDASGLKNPTGDEKIKFTKSASPS